MRLTQVASFRPETEGKSKELTINPVQLFAKGNGERDGT